MGGAESDSQIFDGYGTAAGIDVEEDEAERICERSERAVAQARDEGFYKFEPKEFEFVAQTLEAGNAYLWSFGCGIFSAHGA